MKTITLIASVFLSVSCFAADAAKSDVVWKKCSACHGVNGEKAALGKSRILKDLKAQDIRTALNGYKDGTYGGPMKALMIGQAKPLTKDDIENLSVRFEKK